MAMVQSQKGENLRRLFRSARAAQRVTGKKVQWNGSRQMKCCHLANVRSSPIADKLLQCLEYSLCADFVVKVPNRGVTIFPPEDETSRDRRLI
jgi:hypothetical protein